MHELDLFGKHCRDIVTGFEGICIGMVEWMYGCRTYILQPKSETGYKKNETASFYRKQLEVLDDGISGKVETPSFLPQKFFGKECRDKVTGSVGICVGRIVWLFSGDQYVLEIQPEDQSKDARNLWLDEGRMELTEKQAAAVTPRVEPEKVQGTRTGGVMEDFAYPAVDGIRG